MDNGLEIFISITIIVRTTHICIKTSSIFPKNPFLAYIANKFLHKFETESLFNELFLNNLLKIGNEINLLKFNRQLPIVINLINQFNY